MSDKDTTEIASSDSKRRKLRMDSKKWNDDETTTIIELLEERECLWNAFCNRNIKKDTRGRKLILTLPRRMKGMLNHHH